MKKNLTNVAISLLMSGWAPVLVGSVVAALIMVAIGMPADQVIAGFATGGAGGS